MNKLNVLLVLVLLVGVVLVSGCTSKGRGNDPSVVLDQNQPLSTTPATIVWKKELVFDSTKKDTSPLPINTMNIVAHKGMLFAGMSTDFEADAYSKASSYMYHKKSAVSSWELEKDFGPYTHRVGMLYSASFDKDYLGERIPNGTQSILLATTLHTTRDEKTPLEIRIRNDADDSWSTVTVSKDAVDEYNVRTMQMHIDVVTGIPYVFVGASPAPLGIIKGAYDERAPGKISWNAVPEIVNDKAADSKWFGMVEVNGVLLASDAVAIYRRIDGNNPYWMKVAHVGAFGDESLREVRGLTAIPNLDLLKSGDEAEELLFEVPGGMYRMRVPKDPTQTHVVVQEINLLEFMTQKMGKEVCFIEAAFNELTPIKYGGGFTEWPIGFDMAYSVPNKKCSAKDTSSYELSLKPMVLLRTAGGEYTVENIVDATDPLRNLFLARDFRASPFVGEENVLYAGGFNGSFFKGSLGTAWIYKGTLKE